MNQPKVFGIGLSRTGTKSLVLALRTLGYRAVHWPQTLDKIAEVDAAADITVAHRYRFLDAIFPGSKFVLTTRDRDDWLCSIEAHYESLDEAHQPRTLDQLESEFEVYGSWEFEEMRFLQAIAKHEAEVWDYFHDNGHADQLLEFDVRDGWEPLCAFLGHDVPDEPSPWANRRF